MWKKILIVVLAVWLVWHLLKQRIMNTKGVSVPTETPLQFDPSLIKI